jgi:hypothetical protein
LFYLPVPIKFISIIYVFALIVSKNKPSGAIFQAI